jgi:hypothetical protein
MVHLELPTAICDPILSSEGRSSLYWASSCSYSILTFSTSSSAILL